MVVLGVGLACGPKLGVEDADGDGDGDGDASDSGSASAEASGSDPSAATDTNDDGGTAPQCWEWLGGEARSVLGISATQDGGVIAVGTETLLSIRAFDSAGAIAWEATHPVAGVYHHAIALPSGGIAALGFAEQRGAVHFWSAIGVVTATSAEAPTLAGLYSTGMWWDATQELLAYGYETSAAGPPVLLAMDESGALTRQLDLDGFDDVGALAPLGDGFIACGSQTGTDGQPKWRLVAHDGAGAPLWSLNGEESGDFHCADVATDAASRTVAAIAWSGPGPLYYDAGGVVVLSLIDDAEQWRWSADGFPTVVGGIALADDGTAYVATSKLVANMFATQVEAITNDGSSHLVVETTGPGLLRLPDEIALHDARLFMAGSDSTDKGLEGFVACWDVGGA